MSRWAVNQGTHSHEGASVILRPSQSTWKKETDAEAAIPWNSLTKLSTPVLEIGHVTTPLEQSKWQKAAISQQRCQCPPLKSWWHQSSHSSQSSHPDPAPICSPVRFSPWSASLCIAAPCFSCRLPPGWTGWKLLREYWRERKKPGCFSTSTLFLAASWAAVVTLSWIHFLTGSPSMVAPSTCWLLVIALPTCPSSSGVLELLVANLRVVYDPLLGFSALIIDWVTTSLHRIPSVVNNWSDFYFFSRPGSVAPRMRGSKAALLKWPLCDAGGDSNGFRVPAQLPGRVSDNQA